MPGIDNSLNQNITSHGSRQFSYLQYNLLGSLLVRAMLGVKSLSQQFVVWEITFTTRGSLNTS
jgi:hypothetical protein